jgi:toxin HigB-1
MNGSNVPEGARYAVDASGNWRITFGWDGDDAIDVDLEDYH